MRSLFNDKQTTTEKYIAKSIVELGTDFDEMTVEAFAGLGSTYADEEYANAGAIICNQEQVWEAELILKVKEPMPSEYCLFKKQQIIWGFLHLAANPECVKEMINKNICAIASENIKIDGEFKLLKPVSEIAGRKALFTALHYLEVQNGGSGILGGGVVAQKPVIWQLQLVLK